MQSIGADDIHNSCNKSCRSPAKFDMATVKQFSSQLYEVEKDKKNIKGKQWRTIIHQLPSG